MRQEQRQGDDGDVFRRKPPRPVLVRDCVNLLKYSVTLLDMWRAMREGSSVGGDERSEQVSENEIETLTQAKIATLSRANGR